jgi:hypothetical protein
MEEESPHIVKHTKKCSRLVASTKNASKVDNANLPHRFIQPKVLISTWGLTSQSNFGKILHCCGPQLFSFHYNSSPTISEVLNVPLSRSCEWKKPLFKNSSSFINCFFDFGFDLYFESLCHTFMITCIIFYH